MVILHSARVFAAFAALTKPAVFPFVPALQFTGKRRVWNGRPLHVSTALLQDGGLELLSEKPQEVEDLFEKNKFLKEHESYFKRLVNDGVVDLDTLIKSTDLDNWNRLLKYIDEKNLERLRKGPKNS